MDFDLLTELSQPVEFRSGEKIYEMDYTIGDPCAYLILEGDVRVMRKYTPLKMENFDLTKGDLFEMLEVYLPVHILVSFCYIIMRRLLMVK